MTYTILNNGRAITCRICGLTSYNPHDVEHRYCGKCHIVHDEQLSLKPGDEVLILKGHPWAGETGTLIAHETYGLGWLGWKVRLNHGQECYVQPNKLTVIRAAKLWGRA